MAKRILIEYTPSIDLTQPDAAQLKPEGFADMLEILVALQDAQSNLIATMRAQRDSAIVRAQVERAEQNGLVLARH